MARPGKGEPNQNYQVFEAMWNKSLSNVMKNWSHLRSTGKDERGAAAKDSFATALAWAQLAEKYGYGPGIDLNEKENRKRIEKEARKLQHEIRYSAEFVTVIDDSSLSKVVNMADTKTYKAQKVTAEKPMEQFRELYDRQSERLAPEIQARQERWRLRELMRDLKQSTQKSFTGKLKSWFVGNSNEYKEAYDAMGDLAYDKDMPEEKRTEAKEKIKKYLNLRGKKVRDHQYGRHRFDAFMKGLATVMEPQEFKDYCEQINASRKALDKNNKALVSAKDYMAPEAYQQLEQEQAKTEPTKTEPAKTETVKTGQEPQGMVL